MKFVPIKWRRCSFYEKRQLRRAAVRNAHQTIRQKTRNQLREICIQFDISDYEIIPVEWYENPPDNTPVQYFNDFMHPSIRLGWFD